MAAQSIPIVDLSLPELDAAREIRKACSTVGFFYVKNCGIEADLVDNVFNEVRNFFALPLEEKMKIHHDANDRGYVPPYAERLDQKTKKGDSKERINFGLEDLEGILPLRGPNQWPDPQRLPDFRPTLQAYFDQILALAKERLTRLMALSLGLEKTAFDEYVKNPAVIFHPLHYFKDISDPDQGAFACGEHSDYGIVTVLKTDEVSGLQIKIGEEWIDVPYKPNTFIINIGDMVERLTNGFYKSTIHRVITTHGKERYSIPLFLNPNVNVKIEPLPEFMKEGEGKYEACVYGDYLFNKYATTNATYVGPVTMEKEA